MPHARIRSLLAVAMVAAAVFTTVPGDATASAGAPAPCDALCTRVESELAVFTSWLAENGVLGYVGEVGWPDDAAGEAAKWNALADRWYAAADAAQLPATAWAAGEWWGTTYPMSVYEDRAGGPGVDSLNTQATVIEGHPTTWAYRRGVNAAGAEFGTPVDQPSSEFSNANPGVLDRAYHYDTSATFQYLASRGTRIVRLPFRWERLQPRLGAALEPSALTALKAAVGRAKGAGLEVVLDMHNYGAYYLSDGSVGVRRPLGSAEVTKAHFADAWTRISREFAGESAVYAYGLMNEPTGMQPAAGLSPARRWEIISQAALDGIRRNGDSKTIMVAGYNWSGVQQWRSAHPKKWIVDPSGKHRYEAHHYFDRDNSGKYVRTYDAELADAKARGYGASCTP